MHHRGGLVLKHQNMLGNNSVKNPEATELNFGFHMISHHHHTLPIDLGVSENGIPCKWPFSGK